ncbi:UvrD/REP helicase family protein [uncultured delta proteobacterium]|uniref:DNA 3'-5' helicase n=1 Tax=uncultured delta proteobacterium TaxID=34034 RepID=A0A212JKX6_9DELT|nr:UvrD/REP helicase family protein [uncultured delta proteobacterium]
MIDFSKELNPAQLEAATALDGPVLVIAGAGSGKTRTIVYRLANLVASGVPASKILLLTFTRKAAREMLERAERLVFRSGSAHISLAGVQGGTFHAFAYSVLRTFKPVGFERAATVMDSADMLAALQVCKGDLGLGGKGDKSFPKTQTILGYISKCRNREQDMETLLMREAPHLFPYAPDMQRLAAAYTAFKRDKSLLDYDDLLFELEKLLSVSREALAWCWKKHSHIMIDEYQDTNLVQARLASLLSGFSRGAFGPSPAEGAPDGETPQGGGNIMVVGDDAQSIYAFRGADVRNIRDFPHLFPGTRLIRLEENYRSTQPVLDLANAVLEGASEGYKKHLFTEKKGGDLPQVIRPRSDLSQANVVAQRIAELLALYPAREIAVLFRAGYQSYHLEIQLARMGVRFAKYGGIRYTEAAHVKDAVSFARLAVNPLDFTAFQRMASLTKGIGDKTCRKLYDALRHSDAGTVAKAAKKYPDFGADIAFVDSLRLRHLSPETLFGEIIAHYTPKLQELYPDDYPKRLQGLEQLAQIAASYTDLDLFISDLSLDDPFEEEGEREHVTLSTIHSAKGLEWSAVIIIDLVEERFPSRHALQRHEDLEEERRLMYVAVTRAREYLGLCVPATLYSRGSAVTVPAEPSPFIRIIPSTLYEEWLEGFTGLARRPVFTPPVGAARRSPFDVPDDDAPGDDALGERPAPPREFKPGPARAASIPPVPIADDAARGEGASAGLISPLRQGESGYCRHKVFGRGKIVQFLPPDKYRVNFPGMGLKVIMGAYLEIEKEG